MNIAVLDGRLFTLWLTDEAQESAVFSGVARWDGRALVLDRGTALPLAIHPEWHDRIQRVANEKRAAFY